jgi:hypothetical protein
MGVVCHMQQGADLSWRSFALPTQRFPLDIEQISELAAHAVKAKTKTTEWAAQAGRVSANRHATAPN